MTRHVKLKLPRAGTVAGKVLDRLIKQGKNWWFPKTEQEARSLRYLRSRGWPVEDFNPEKVGGRNSYRLDPERMARISGYTT